MQFTFGNQKNLEAKLGQSAEVNKQRQNSLRKVEGKFVNEIAEYRFKQILKN